jgi:hypothetical protein
MNGKGSKQRPCQVSREEWQRRWEAAFGKKQTPCYNESFPVEPEADGVSTGGKERSRTTKAV